MFRIDTVLKHYSLLFLRKVLDLPLTASHLPLPYPHHSTLVLCWSTDLLSHTSAPYCCPTHPSTPSLLHTAVPLPSAGPIQPSTSPLPPTPAFPTFASVLRSKADQPQSPVAVKNEGADFTVIDRKKNRKVSTERPESKQQAQRGTGVNIDSWCAPPGIAKLRVLLPRQGAAIITIRRRITRIIGECRLPEIMIMRRCSKNGYTTP